MLILQSMLQSQHKFYLRCSLEYAEIHVLELFVLGKAKIVKNENTLLRILFSLRFYHLKSKDFGHQVCKFLILLLTFSEDLITLPPCHLSLKNV